MKLTIYDLKNGVGIDNKKNIQIRLSGEDVKFIATEYSISLFIDEETADRMAFSLNSLLQDLERKKSLDRIRFIVYN